MSVSGSELTESNPCESLYFQPDQEPGSWPDVNWKRKYIMEWPGAIRKLNKVVSYFASNNQNSALWNEIPLAPNLSRHFKLMRKEKNWVLVFCIFYFHRTIKHAGIIWLPRSPKVTYSFCRKSVWKAFNSANVRGWEVYWIECEVKCKIPILDMEKGHLWFWNRMDNSCTQN